MTLLERLQQAKLNANNTSNVVASEAEKNVNVQQATLNELKTQVDINISKIETIAPTALQIRLNGIASQNSAIIGENLQKASEKALTNAVTLTNTQPVKLSLLDIIRNRKASMSAEDIERDREENQKQAAINIKPLILTAPVQAPTIQSTPTHREQGNIATKVAEGLKERLTRLAMEAQNNNLPIPAKVDSLLGESSSSALAVEQKAIRVNETFSLNITLNSKQMSAVHMAEQGKSFVLLGAAGTGKTSSEGAMLHKILASDTLDTTNYKQGAKRSEAPSVAVVAYTRRAVANSAKAILKDPILNESLPNNIMTIHTLLEYEPVTYYDAVLEKEVFRFLPKRNKDNKLNITHLIIEEATLVGIDLWQALYEALPYDVQIIFVGDINQLPPVFGPSILNYALTQLPVVELTEVYRQAEGSPIINNAHRILKGEMIVEQSNDNGKLVLVSGKSEVKVGQEKTFAALSNMFKQFYDAELYNPDEDMILSPWNKHLLGTDSLNNMVAEFLSVKNKTMVYEVLAGFHKRYFAEGDKVIVNKRDAIIVGIDRNPAYIGREPKMPSDTLSRFGNYRLGASHADDLDEMASDSDGVIDYSNFSIDEIEETSMERKMQASHKITIAYDTGYVETISAASDLAPSLFSLGYAMTVHKSQGSEWRRVFIIFHPDHMISLSREMLYTAITRAREEVYLIAKRYVVDKAVLTQRVKGNTLEDKILIFNSGLLEENDSSVRATKYSLGHKYNTDDYEYEE